MLIRASHLPVVDAKGSLKGFLSKEKLQKELAAFSTKNEDWEEIPSSFLEKEIPDGFIEYFKYNESIPVLGLNGVKITDWDKAKLLLEYSYISPREVKSPEEKKESTDTIDKKSSRDPVAWLMKKILESFSEPLFVTDTNGNHLFFNESFEKNILKKSFFRNSIEYAQKYLKDFNRDLFANEIKNSGLDIEKVLQKGKSLSSTIPQIGYKVQVVLLMEKDKPFGYLYQFQELPKKTSHKANEFPNLEEAIQNQIPINEILKEVERTYIQKILEKSNFNISHTAKALGIPRSTLQNRMKQLSIQETHSQPTLSPKSKKSLPKSLKKSQKVAPKKKKVAKIKKKKK